MRRFLIISSFMQMVTINSCLHSMQSCLTSASTQPDSALLVKFTGISDGIDVIIKEQDARASKVLNAFLNFPPNSQTLQTREKVWPLGQISFANFINSFDVEKMKHYLSCISDKIDICQSCCNETIDKNIKQLLLSNFFDIEELHQAEINAIAKKFKNPRELISVYENNSELSSLMQSIPEPVQREITKKLFAPFYMQYTLIGDRRILEESCFKFSHDGKRIITILGNGDICIWCTKNGKLVHRLNAEGNITHCAEFSPNDNYVATTSGKKVYIWNSNNFKLIRTLSHADPVLHVEFSNNGNHIVTTSSNYKMYVWNATTGQLMHILQADWQELQRFCCYAKFSPNDNQILVVSASGGVIIFNAHTGQRMINEEISLNRYITLLKFSPDGNYIVADSMMQDLCIWNAHTLQVIDEIRNNRNRIFDIAFNASSDKIMVLNSNNEIQIYDLPSCQLVHTLERKGNGQVGRAQFSPDGSRIITVHNNFNISRNDISLDNDDIETYAAAVHIWNAQTGKLLHTIKESSYISSAEFSADGDHVLIRSSRAGLAHLWTKSIELNTDNNCHALEQALFMQVMASSGQCNQMLDLNKVENGALRQIFQTFSPEEKKCIKKILNIKNNLENHEDSAAASDI